jgi:hypothetical protein
LNPKPKRRAQVALLVSVVPHEAAYAALAPVAVRGEGQLGVKAFRKQEQYISCSTNNTISYD